MTSSLVVGRSSSSTLSTRQWDYDVFLSFSGEDTRKNFTAHLYHSLELRGIKTYIHDEEQLERGNEITTLLRAIEKSRFAIVVCSQNYASSRWCLDELAKILECKKTRGQIILPVFYKVNPQDVRLQTGSFGDAFAKHEKRFKVDQRKMVKWRTALREVSNASGWHLDNNSYETQVIGELVWRIAVEVVKHPVKHIVEHPDEIESPAQELHSSSSPSPVEIESPAQEHHLSSSPSPLRTETRNQVPLLSSSPSGNGEQGNNPSISSEQGSNSSTLSQGVILIFIGLVIGLLQLDNLFETHPVNMWICQAALVMFCLSYAAMIKINGTRWAKYSQIIDIFRILSGTLVAVSLSSIHLPHQLWWLFFAIWALLAFIIVAGTWIYSRVEGMRVETRMSLPQV